MSVLLGIAAAMWIGQGIATTRRCVSPGVGGAPGGGVRVRGLCLPARARFCGAMTEQRSNGSNCAIGGSTRQIQVGDKSVASISSIFGGRDGFETSIVNRRWAAANIREDAADQGARKSDIKSSILEA